MWLLLLPPDAPAGGAAVAMVAGAAAVRQGEAERLVGRRSNEEAASAAASAAAVALVAMGRPRSRGDSTHSCGFLNILSPWQGLVTGPRSVARVWVCRRVSVLLYMVAAKGVSVWVCSDGRLSGGLDMNPTSGVQ